MRYRLSFAMLACACAVPALASDIDRVNQLVQADFRDLSKDLSAAVSYKAVVPIEPLGVTGFDVGFEVTATELEHRGAWDSASSGSAPRTVYLPKLHLHKGLPAGIDIGASYGTAADSNIDVWGAEIRYALLKGGTATPAIGLRGSYAKLSGVEQLDFETRGLELGISKGFAFFTPYAGIGRIWAEASPVGTTTNNLRAEKFSDSKVYVGGNINFVAGNVAFEADRVGETLSYSVKLGFRF